MRVVIIGGGFAGLTVARKLRDAPVEITLIDRRNFHLFQPLLYQVATGGLSPANIATPLRAILSRQANARVLLGDVTGIEPEGRRVRLSDGEDLPYDILVLATGSRHHYFGHPEWEPLAPGLKTLEDALEIRSRLLLAFETAERLGPVEAARPWLTFVIVGGGPTGVELAGAIAEIARQTLRHEFRVIHPGDARVLLLEALDRVLPPYPQSLSQEAQQQLEDLGVEVRTAVSVVAVDDAGVTVESAAGRERIEARTVLWAAGVMATPPGGRLDELFGAQMDRAGRIFVAPDLSLPGAPGVYVVGDLAHCEQDGATLPAVAPVALQQGEYVARAIKARLEDRPLTPFRYRSRGMLATIGRSSAVADLGLVRLSGLPAWITWLTVHIMNLARFENRLLVLVQWGWSYFTRGRSARLITGRRAIQESSKD